MEEQYKKYETKANQEWDLTKFGFPKDVKISFEDFPNNIRLQLPYEDLLLIEAYREGLYDVNGLQEIFADDVEWEIGVWSITDSAWLEDVAPFQKLGEVFKIMKKRAAKISRKKIRKADKQFSNIGKKPVKKFDVTNYAL